MQDYLCWTLKSHTQFIHQLNWVDQTLCVLKSPFQWSSLPLWACLVSGVASNGELMSLILSVNSTVVPTYAMRPRPYDDHYQDSAVTASYLALTMPKFENRLRQIN